MRWKNWAGAVLSLALGLSPAALRAEDVTIAGCAQAGVETGCVVMASGGKLYNITAAKPTPKLGVPGLVVGTVSAGVSLCQQGIILSPATWEAVTGASCTDPAPR